MDIRRRIALPVAIAFLVGACAGQSSPPPASPASSAGSSPAATPAATASVPSTSATLETVTLAPNQSPLLGDVSWESLRPTPAGFVLRGLDADRASLLAYASPDGRSWSHYDLGHIGNVVDIVAGPLGWVLAARPADGGLTHLWFSTDGLTWGRLADPPDLGVSTSTHLESGALGFALTGFIDEAGSSTTAVWTSRDGRTWSRGHLPTDSGIETVTVLDHAFLGSASVAATVAWSSLDGIDWRKSTVIGSDPTLAATVLAIPSGDDVVVVAATGPNGGLVSVRGHVSVSGEGTLLAWGAPAAPAGFGASSAVAGATSATTRVVLGFDQTFKPVSWRNADGLAWARAGLEPTAFGGGVPRLLAAGPSGWVAIGWRPGASGSQARQPWRSDDGVSWQPVDAPMFLAAPASDTPEPCPATAPTRVEDVIARDAKVWPACFGAATLKIRGYMADCGGCGGETGYLASPQWLIDPLGYAAFYLSPAVVPAARGGSNYGFQVDPAHPVKVPAVGTHVEVTGHFDDRASATCRIFPAPGIAADLPPPDQAIQFCRETFVATGIRVLGS